MNYEGSFDEKAEVTWQEQKPRPPNLSHLQGAMFMDRPDLWPVKKPKPRRSAQPLPGQPSLVIEEIKKGDPNGREPC